MFQLAPLSDCNQEGLQQCARHRVDPLFVEADFLALKEVCGLVVLQLHEVIHHNFELAIGEDHRLWLSIVLPTGDQNNQLRK